MTKGFLQKKGTTLIEILMYFSIVGLILFSIMTFSLQILSVNSLSTNYQELQSNLNFITNRIVSTIKIADSVNLDASVFDNDNGALSLNMDDPIIPQTTFYLLDNELYTDQGGTQTKLSSDSIKFDSLRFHRVTFPKTPDQIIIDAKLSPKHAEISNINKEMEIHLSISLRYL